jgi:hypothetical protein
LRPEPSAAFERVMLLASSWFILGVFIDGWAHNNIPGLETFFTPWHAILYSGYLATALTLGSMTAINASNGVPLLRAIPRGYELSALGVVVFAVGGLLDLTWHLAFGIEQDFAALLSPTHLILATGGILIASGPLRTALARGSLGIQGLVSLTLIVGILEFFTQFTFQLGFAQAAAPTSPFWRGLSPDQTFVLTERALEFGVANVVIRAALIAGTLLFVLRNFAPRFGTFTTLYSVTWGLMTLMIAAPRWPLVAVQIGCALVAGLLADVLATGRTNVRIIASVVPAAWFALLLGIGAATTGTWWVIHISTGSIVYAGMTGLLLSYLAFPPGGAAGPATSARL